MDIWSSTLFEIGVMSPFAPELSQSNAWNKKNYGKFGIVTNAGITAIGAFIYSLWIIYKMNE